MPNIDEEIDDDAEISPVEDEAPVEHQPTARERKIAREAQSLRTRLRETEARETELNTQVQSLSARAQRDDVRNAMGAVVPRESVTDIGLLETLVFVQCDKLTFENGEVKGLDDLIKSIRAKHPSLFTDTTGNPDGDEKSAPKTFDGNKLIRKMAGL